MNYIKMLCSPKNLLENYYEKKAKVSLRFCLSTTIVRLKLSPIQLSVTSNLSSYHTVTYIARYSVVYKIQITSNHCNINECKHNNTTYWKPEFSHSAKVAKNYLMTVIAARKAVGSGTASTAMAGITTSSSLRIAKVM